MGQLTRGQILDIKDIVRRYIPDADFCAESSWNGKEEYIFDDTCGCYSEWTIESCHLTLFFKGTVLEGDKGWEDVRQAESAVEDYALGALHWHGCECCGDRLYVNLRMFRKGVD